VEKRGLARDLAAALNPTPVETVAVETVAVETVAVETVAVETVAASGDASGAPLAGAVVFCDEMRLGLLGQVRRIWAPVGEKVEQVVQIVYQWTSLLLAVDPIGGRLTWSWVTHMRGAVLGPVMAIWKAMGVAAVVLDNAPGHRNPVLRTVAPPLVPLPPYSPELDPAERIFRALRPEIEGEAYPTLEATRARADTWLRELAADPARVRSLTAWDWLTAQVTAARTSP
jgi:hypothetical protein